MHPPQPSSLVEASGVRSRSGCTNEAKVKVYAVFSVGRFKEEVKHFTDAIPRNHVLYSNSSTVLSLLHCYSDTLADRRKGKRYRWWWGSRVSWRKKKMDWKREDSIWIFPLLLSKMDTLFRLPIGDDFYCFNPF
jgi:hypothetical protein